MQLNLHTSYKEKLGMLHYLSRSITVIPIDCFRLCFLISLSFLCQDENEKKTSSLLFPDTCSLGNFSLGGEIPHIHTQ